jgi:4-diphosphocytidyl-2-C-methyl-D-erythritol kinase
VACKLYPEVSRHLAWLDISGQARMTGSGACVFAEFANRDQAETVFRQLPRDMRGTVTQGLAQHPLHDWVLD